MTHPKRQASSGVGLPRRMLVAQACLVLFSLLPAAHAAASASQRPDGIAAAGPRAFERARALERAGQMREAFSFYLASADSGYGPAQRRLGNIYGAGNEVVPRDYAKAVQWLKKARENGERVPEPRLFRWPLGYEP